MCTQGPDNKPAVITKSGIICKESFGFETNVHAQRIVNLWQDQ
jgi:hypothetical protein